MVASSALWASGAAFARYSSIVVDGESGKVLSEVNADATSYPASLTKMMTLYLAFEALEQRKLTLDQRLVVSKHAAAQEPSKLDLEPGESISVRDLILAICTHSANDAAVTVAEGLGGSEAGFAEHMTQKAHELGMANTTFQNASGLPRPPNVTTARDLVKLARALYRNFPKEYAYFSTEEFTFRGHVYANHNHLMHAFAGMDGIKTGYINASGFNLAASAVRDNHRLIAVIMGGESAHSRDMKMAQLLNQTFARVNSAGDVQMVEDLQGSPDADDSNSLAHRAKRVIAALSPVTRAEAATPAVERTAAPRQRLVKLQNPGWTIQVGAFSQRNAAERAGSQTLAKLPSGFKGRSIIITAPQHGAKAKVFRARIGHFTEHDAEIACRALHKKHGSCAVIAPEATQMASR